MKKVMSYMTRVERKAIVPDRVGFCPPPPPPLVLAEARHNYYFFGVIVGGVNFVLSFWFSSVL